jgi:hypothetical protein
VLVHRESHSLWRRKRVQIRDHPVRATL